MRRLCYISGSRADFGLLCGTLLQAQRSGNLEVGVCATGTHLLTHYGETVREIEGSGLRICGRIPVALDGTSGAVMAKAIGAELAGITEVLERERPDLVLVLGDRGEMIAGALAALHLNIVIVHVHGGERSGTVDEPIRHAISKLAHYHLVATPGAKERLVRMGEAPERIFVTGAPGLDGLRARAQLDRPELFRMRRLDAGRPLAMVLFHPVVQQAGDMGRQMEEIMRAIRACNIQALVFGANSDAGGCDIDHVIKAHARHPDFRIVSHLDRSEFLSWMAVADVMVGNSSSGIIEAASFGLPVVNVGERQQYRERSKNTVDVAAQAWVIQNALESAVAGGRKEWVNVYGDGNAGARIVNHLVHLPIGPEVLQKANAY